MRIFSNFLKKKATVFITCVCIHKNNWKRHMRAQAITLKIKSKEHLLVFVEFIRLIMGKRL